LRNFLTRTHLQDLIETTAQIHYEAFRAKQLMAIKESSGSQASLASPAASNHNPQGMTSPSGLGSNVLTSPQTIGSPAQSQK
jgi:septin 3/9/12